MSIPPLRRWRPCCDLRQIRNCGWTFVIHPHPDNNPIVVVQHWMNEWLIEFFRLSYRTGHGWHIHPRWQ